MFLTQEPHNIEDFLKSVNFVAPQGMNLKYFIVPVDTATQQLNVAATEEGFTPEQELSVPGVTDTITYTRRQAVDRNAMADSNFNPAARPAAYPVHAVAQRPQTPEENILMNGGMVKSPVRGNLIPNGAEEVAESRTFNRRRLSNKPVKIIRESRKSVTLMLTESIGLLPKNTLLNFTRGE